MFQTIGCAAESSDESHARNTSVARRESIALRDSKLIDALRRSKLYRDYDRTFSEVTGLPLALRPVEFFGLPFHGKKHENAFCAFLADRKRSCSPCLQTQGLLAELAGKCPHSVQCPFGLTETAVPIRIGERVIGFLCTGQVFTRKPNPGNSTLKRKRLFTEASAAEQEALRLWKQTPLIETAKYKAMVRLLIFFANQLAALSNQLLIEQKCREPEVVTRARRFISENKRGRLSLASVAKASGSSMFHFCTLFHQTTGLKFRDYVARSRIEDARVLLCDPTRRMSEVAYKVGFQSMTAFHRAFRRIQGESPTEYRSHLAAHGSYRRQSSIRSRDSEGQSPGPAYRSPPKSTNEVRSTARYRSLRPAA
jgi:AraC-like DNA-binding protein/ligand-binding sensor protein